MIEPLNTKVELFRWGPVPAKFFYVSDFCLAIMREFPQEFPGAYWPKTLILKKDGKFIWLNELPELESIGGEVFKKYLIDGKVKENSKAGWRERKTALQEVERVIDNTHLPELSNEEFFDLWQTLHQRIKDFWMHSITPELGNYGAEKLLRDKLMPQVPAAEMTRLMEILSAPVEKSFFQIEEIDLAETNDLIAHQQEYSWLRNSYSNVEVLPVSFFEERKKELMPDLRAHVEGKLREAAARKEEVIQEFGLDEETRAIAENLAEALMWQDARKKEVWVYLYHTNLLLKELARRSGIPYESLEESDAEEVLGMARAGEFNPRTQPFAIFVGQEYQFFSGEEAERLWDIYAVDKNDAITELRGTVASRSTNGPIRGRVKIVHDPFAADNFKEGAILVAPMTAAEYVFLMKKASAIVTDVGGLTSHAAVVSRELGKPCIIGTKYATQFLKDGDEIEVDTEKGVVRKI